MQFRNRPSSTLGLVVAAVGLLSAGQLSAGSVWGETVWSESRAVEAQEEKAAAEAKAQAEATQVEAHKNGGSQATRGAGSEEASPARSQAVSNAAKKPTPAAVTTKSTVETAGKVQGTENFIVQAASMEVALHAVEQVGGKITHRLGIIDAVAADLTPEQIKALQESEGVKLHANRKVSIEK